MPVYKDEKRGTYYISYSYINSMGKRVNTKKRGYKTKKEAKEAEATIMLEINRGSFIEPSKVTINEYFPEWLIHKTDLSNQTRMMYERVFKNHISPCLGSLSLQALKPFHIQKFVKELKDKGLETSTIKRNFNIINACLNSAVSMDIIKDNVAKKVDTPKVSYKELNIWTTEQSIEFLSLNQHHELFPLFALAINTGMRQGELLGLRWKDINFDEQTLMIRQTLEHDGKNIKAGAKTTSSIRTIGLPTSVIPILIEHKRQQESNLDILGLSNDLDLVFITGNKQMSPRNVTRRFQNAIKHTNLPVIRFHDLRHIYASILIANNAPIKHVSSTLGHSKISTTMDTYVHLMPAQMRDITNQIGEALLGKA